MISLRKFHVVVATSLPEFGIGFEGKLPWQIKEDMKHFKQITTDTSDAKRQNAVIMGRKTWESIPSKFRPLPNRLNIVLTRNPKSELAQKIGETDNALVASSFGKALDYLSWPPYSDQIESVYIIGGSNVYSEAVSKQFSPYLQSIYLTKVFKSFPKCDAHLDIDLTAYKEVELSRKHVSASDETIQYQIMQLLPTPPTEEPSKEAMVKEATKEAIKEMTKSTETTADSIAATAAATSTTIVNRAETQSTSIDQENDPTQANKALKNQVKMDEKDSAGDDENEKERKLDMGEMSASIGANCFDTNTHKAGMHEEYQYLQLISHIINHGVERSDRTGTGTRSIFGATMRFNLRNDNFPLLTTKRVFWRGVAQELLWFVQGCTDAKELEKKNIHIWDGNGSREFLDQRGLTENEVGDLGPVYGFQWRHFGAEYKHCHADYSNQGVDQLMNVINQIKTNPYSRRIVMTAWNPSDLSKMALPPCHMFCQFYVANGELSCQMYQRSADMGLGVPFNIASYSLLTRMIAQVCDLKCGDFVHCIGDCHVYLNHIEPLKEQLKRTPNQFPTLRMNPNKTGIDSFVYEDFKVVGYKPQKSIKMKMAV